MNIRTLALSIVLIVIPLQSSASIASWFNPIAWFKAMYHYTHKEEMFRARMKLESLYRLRDETDNLYKIYSSMGKYLSENYRNKELVADLKGGINKLKPIFTTQQSQWKQLSEKEKDPLSLHEIDTYESEILEPAIRDAEKENSVAHTVLPQSWYQQLKEQYPLIQQEESLPQSERMKIQQRRENEFRIWQALNMLSFKNKFPDSPKIKLSAASKALQAARDEREARKNEAIS